MSFLLTVVVVAAVAFIAQHFLNKKPPVRPHIGSGGGPYKIVVYGVGGIGSTVAAQLSNAGHHVTCIARGKRLQQLQRDRAIVRVDGSRATVAVTDVLDPAVAYDLVVVTVTVTGVDAILTALKATPAKKIMFFFSTFELFDRLRAAVGAERFAWGFPIVMATVDAETGCLESNIINGLLSSTMTDAEWARIFTDAGLPAITHPDMESWLRTHTAWSLPAMVACVVSYGRGAGLTWAEATTYGRAFHEAIDVVRRLKHQITPRPLALSSYLPAPVWAALLWLISRMPSVRKVGQVGPTEARALIDSMNGAAPGQIPLLMSIRP